MGRLELLIFVFCRLYLLLSCSFIVHGQLGFISIDCGKPRGYSGNDSHTGLQYVSDYQYTDDGETHNISSIFQGLNVSSQAHDLRSFPNGIRNCYNLNPVLPGNKYLIRASFLYGNYDGKNYYPKFDLYLGTTLWESISISSASVKYDTTIYSVASYSYMFVCLLNIGSGTPFISSLELRPLDDDMYYQINSTSYKSLVSVHLVNFGASADSIIRYPQDIYDRTWTAYNQLGWTRLSTTENVSTHNRYRPPSEVMQTAVKPTSGSSLNFSFKLTDSHYSPHNLFMHFAELEVLRTNESRKIGMTKNGARYYNFTPNYLSITTVFNTRPRYYPELDISLYMFNGSTLPPIINAMEIYKILQPTETATDSEDVDAIMSIKTLYHVKKRWMGDPCVPQKLTWDGLGCSYDASPRIISLNLTASRLTGQLSFSFTKLAELRELDLSRNNLKGKVPEFLASLVHLEFLNLTGSGLCGPLPKSLVDRSKNGPLIVSFGNDQKSSQRPIQHVEENNKKKTDVILIAVASTISTVVVVLLLVALVWILRSHKQQHELRSTAGKQAFGNCPRKATEPEGLRSYQLDSRKFTYAELVNITKNFENKIGEGGFGTVYHGILENLVQVAVKVLSAVSSQGHKEFQSEARLLSRVHHKNIVPFVGYCMEKNHLALVYEYMAQGNLAMHLSDEIPRHLNVETNPLCWSDRLRIATEVAEGLEYLHKGCSPFIIHRDIKASNILLNKKLEAKLADFGLSKTFNNDTVTQQTTAIKGTRGYLDPYSITLDQRSDVYAFGVVLLELITGQPAIIKEAGSICLTEWVQEHYKRGELHSIVDRRVKGQYNSNLIQRALETAMTCVSPYANGRPDMTRVLTLLKECSETELVNFTSSSNSNTVNSSNFTSEFFRPGNGSTEIGPFAR